MKLRLIRKQKPLDDPYWFTERLTDSGRWEFVSNSLKTHQEEAEQFFDKLIAIGDQPEVTEVVRESP